MNSSLTVIWQEVSLCMQVFVILWISHATLSEEVRRFQRAPPAELKMFQHYVITVRGPVDESRVFRTQQFPQNDVDESQHTYTEMKNDTTNVACGVRSNIPGGFEHWYKVKDILQRSKRAVQEQQVIEVFVIMDKALFSGTSMKSDITKAEKYITDVVGQTDTWFTSDFNIRVVLVGIELWTADRVSVVTDPKQLLTNTLMYSSKDLNSTRHDIVVLISGIDFDGTLAGMAYVGVICGPLSGVVIQHFPSDPRPELKSAVLLAHEMGHVIGLTHDTSSCGPTGTYIMAEDIAKKPTTFSSCSKTEMHAVLSQGQGHCMYDIPVAVYHGPICGNGVTETGEMCDCGDVVGCSKDSCCMYPCKLRAGAQCGSGGCCSNCKLQKLGTECRKAGSLCDIPEVCSGLQPECPANHYKSDMMSCMTSGVQGNCYRGTCRSNMEQCERLWGVGLARPGELLCYGDNAKGDSLGNCGSSSVGTFTKCKISDLMCGTLQCETTVTSPLLGSGQIIAAKIKSAPNGTKYTCKAATINLGVDVPDPGLVDDGSPCYDVSKKTNGVCLSGTCIKKEDFPTKTCPKGSGGKECSNNGVCTEVGSCFCNHGYGGISCSHMVTIPTVITSISTSSSMVVDTTTTTDKASQGDRPVLPVWTMVVIAVLGVLILTAVVVLVLWVAVYRKRNRVKEISLNHSTVVTVINGKASAKSSKSGAGPKRAQGKQEMRKPNTQNNSLRI